MKSTTYDLPLKPYQVLDLTIARAGPVAVRLLADWGAEVIRVEAPPKKDRGSVTGRRRGADEQNLHRNKRAVCIDLKSSEGKRVFQRLVRDSDIVVENFRADVKARLGLTFEELKKINPKIILASISGFGQDGPYSSRPAVDQVIQGMSGLSSMTGDPNGGIPMRVGVAIADTTAGMYLGQGILVALLHRERTGKGQWVHTSLIEGMISKLDFQAARYTVDGTVPKQVGNAHPTASAMNTYPASDGLVNIAASTQRMWDSFCQALNAKSLHENPEFIELSSRVKNRSKLDQAITEVTRKFTVSELVTRLTDAGVPCGPIYTIDQTFADPQVQHLKMTIPATHSSLGKLELIRSPINFSEFPHPESFDRAAPDAGEHTQEILTELGLSAHEIEELKEKGVVA